MRSFRRGTGVVFALLLLAPPVAGAAAAPQKDEKERPPSRQHAATAGGQGHQRPADPVQQRARKKPVEPQGSPSSASAMRAGKLICGQVITKSTTLTADVGPCPADGIIVGADNIRLNLNGHTRSGAAGPGDGNAAGIRLPFRTGIIVTGHPGKSGKIGTVTGFDAGVFINGGSKNTVENLVIRDNIGPGADMGEEGNLPLEPPLGELPLPPPSNDAALSDGIVLFHSANNRIINNLISHNGPYDGIGVLGLDSNNNLIHGNTVEDTAGKAPFEGGDGTGVMIHNFLDEERSPRRGESIRNNQVIANVVRRNDNSGISNISNVEGRIEGNIVEDNGQQGEQCADIFGFTCFPRAFPSNGIGVSKGLIATEFTRVLVANNKVTGNTGNGIAVGAYGLRGNTRQNRIIGNVATANGNNEWDRYDLHDFSFNEGSARPFNCDENVWRDNVFKTAFPECVYEQQGLAPPPG